MTILIIEDEKPAQDKLIAALKHYDPSIAVAGLLTSIKDSIRWLSGNPTPDLILLDIELADGRSLEIFKHCAVTCPVIFITAYDEYLLESFEYNSIDYLLKPVRQEKLEGALNKYLKLRTHFDADLRKLDLGTRGKFKDRILVKKGIDFVSVKTAAIAYFYTEFKIVFLIDTQGVKYMIDRPLAELEAAFDPHEFCRINRKYLAHVQAIEKFKSLGNGKLKVELRPPVKEDVLVSQERAHSFRNWMER